MEEVLCVRPAWLREERLTAEPREQRGELVGVPFLVQEVGAEDEIPRRGTEQRFGLAPPDARNAERRTVPFGVATQEIDRVLRPVCCEHVGAAQRRGERRQAEPAAELENLATR